MKLRIFHVKQFTMFTYKQEIDKTIERTINKQKEKQTHKKSTLLIYEKGIE